jgi:hypothetical protein
MLSVAMKKAQNARKGLLPLVVGVTGHRDLAADEVPNVVQHVRQLFVTLEEKYPHTPIVLLSSLAEGADRLVARTALDCGAELYVILPMQVASYEEDFASAQSLDEFRDLMRRSYGAGVARAPGTDRDLQYVAAGAFLVSHSQILIALWDGEENEMLGGTSQIVRFALQGVPAKYLSGSRGALCANETGAVYHVPVRRESGKLSVGVANGTSWRYPGTAASEPAAVQAARSAFEESLRSLERFNRDATTPVVERQSARSAGYLLRERQETPLNVDGALNYTRKLFGQADALALRCRNSTHMATIVIFGAIAAAAVLFSLYTNVLTNDSTLFFVFLGVVAAAFGVDLIIVRERMQDRFQDYRALAEGLRVQFYWRLAGIHESVYEHYLARQEGELDWIRNAMRAAIFRRQVEPETGFDETQMQQLFEIVLAQWINDQAAYFSKAVRREQELATRIKWGANACLIVTGVIAIALAVSLAGHSSTYHGSLVMLLTLALAGAGLLTGYAQKRAHEEHARRYQRMYALYRIASERVAALLREHDVAAARGVLVALGREALAETCDWLLLHRERQIDVPTA